MAPDTGCFCIKANSTCIFYLPRWLDPLCLGFVAKDWTIKISQSPFSSLWTKPSQASVPYSQQLLLPVDEKVKLGTASRAFRTFSIEMQTLLWRLRDFWEAVGFWLSLQKIWRSSPVRGCFKRFSFQVYSGKVSSGLSLAGQTPNLNAEQKSNFFLPNLGLWPVDLRTLPCHLSSPGAARPACQQPSSPYPHPRATTALWQHVRWLDTPNTDHL